MQPFPVKSIKMSGVYELLILLSTLHTVHSFVSIFIFCTMIHISCLNESSWTIWKFKTLNYAADVEYLCKHLVCQFISNIISLSTFHMSKCVYKSRVGTKWTIQNKILPTVMYSVRNNIKFIEYLDIRLNRSILWNFLVWHAVFLVTELLSMK